jgi:diphthine-ammonia ligase
MTKSSFCSWSGGKDSCLALYKAVSQEYSIKYLLSMMSEEGDRSRSHGLSSGILFKQAESLKIKMIQKHSSWENYEYVFTSALEDFKKQHIEYGVFGDIDTQAHLDWVNKICNTTGMKYLEPLWKCKRENVIKDFLDAGFKGIIVSCDVIKMGKDFLGREITTGLVNELHSLGIDAAGENGEYHTFVYDGPLFNGSIDFIKKDIVVHGNYAFLELE